MERYRHFLQDKGIIYLKTDSNFLFTYTTYMVQKNHLPLIAHTTDLYATASASTVPGASPSTVPGGSLAWKEASSIQTYYESMWIARGISIKYMKWQLPHDGMLEEPDVEIELDDYRSYHRNKRSSLETSK